MEKMAHLFERFVIAIEFIAETLEERLTVQEPSVIQETPQPSPHPAGAAYPSEDDREAWVLMARDRGIEVPKGTRTPTIVKQVRAYDAARPAATTPPAKEEPDPFAVIEDPAPTEEKITREAVLAEMQKVMKDKGKDKVLEILQNNAGTQFMKDVPEDKLVAVMNAAKEALNG